MIGNDAEIKHVNAMTPQATYAKLSTAVDEMEAKRAGFEGKIAALRAKSEALQRDRVESTLAGQPFKSKGELAQLTEEIDALSGASDELTRRIDDLAPALDDARKRAKVDDVRQHLVEELAKHLGEVERVERAISEAVSGLKAIDEINSRMAAIRHGLGTHNEFNNINVRNRMGGRIGRQLSKLGPNPVYGNLTWMPEQVRDENWTAEERDVVQREITGSIASLGLPPSPKGYEAVLALIEEDKRKPKGPAVAG